MNNHALKLYQYNTWANARIIGHLKNLPEDLCHTAVTSVFPNITAVLIHIYIIDRGWYAVLTNEYASDDYEAIRQSVEQLIQETQNNSLDEIAARFADVSQKTEAFLSAHDVDVINVYSGVPMSLADVVQHIVNHGSYHRGNISAMLHQLGHSGVPVDYGYYLYTLIKN